MFLTLILAAFADSITLDSGAAMEGDLARYELGGDCQISVTDGPMAGVIVIVPCYRVESFVRTTVRQPQPVGRIPALEDAVAAAPAPAAADIEPATVLGVARNVPPAAPAPMGPPAAGPAPMSAAPVAPDSTTFADLSPIAPPPAAPEPPPLAHTSVAPTTLVPPAVAVPAPAPAAPAPVPAAPAAAAPMSAAVSPAERALADHASRPYTPPGLPNAAPTMPEAMRIDVAPPQTTDLEDELEEEPLDEIPLAQPYLDVPTQESEVVPRPAPVSVNRTVRF